MDERESSVASSADFYESEPQPATTAPAAHGDMAVAKRKAEDESSAHDKKRKLGSPSKFISSDLRWTAGLPPAVWQHIFLSCSLKDLGRLMQVNRSFLLYLTDVHNVSMSKADATCLRLLKSESVWASARNAHSPKPPKPLPGFTERQTWQLAWLKKCQFCNKASSFTPGEKIWRRGPGSSGVRTIWPFGIRSCGPCLMEQCQTETSLLFSTASALRPALPFTLITKDKHYIPAHHLQTTTTPPEVEIGKYYSKKHVEDITQDLNDALSLGPAAAEEWSKGLDAKGKERMKVAENWERWETRDQQEQQRQATAVLSDATRLHKEASQSPPRQPPSPIIHTPVPVGKYTSYVSCAAKNIGVVRQLNTTSSLPNLTAAAPSSQYAHSRPPTVPPQVFTPQPGQSGSTQPSHQRNLHDANEAKASRKTDIERRCQQMNPPIPPNILRHMDSFKAALQISQPMTDYAWTVLEPRLLAQLPAAQQAEANHVSHAASLSTKSADRRFQDVNSKEAKEAMDREWEDLQRPIRDKLSAIADDFINQDWDHGKALTFESCPKFAADLLMHVRRNYKEDTKMEHGASPLQHNGFTNEAESKPKLVLENMKWVYDNKIKPLTEQFRKDLFFCNGQDCESSMRPYGFEGVVQHFGAKHTHAFSSGNIVVAWREAEWPEETPFHPDPLAVQPFHQGHPSTSSGYTGHFGGYSRAGTVTPHMLPHMPQASPGPYGYGGHYNGPFLPPQAPGAPLTGYEYVQPYNNPVDSYAFGPMAPPGYASQMGTGSYMPSPAMINPGVAPPPPAMPPPPGQSLPGAIPDVAENAGHSTSLYDKHVSTVIELSQDIWKQTSGIKDMPNSLRIYVLIHRVISNFQVEFNHEPNLAHFIDAFSNHEIPKALKLAPGLSCKTCQADLSHQLTGAHYAKPIERKTYTLSNLLSHFKIQHLAPQPYATGYGQQNAQLDWKEDMIELPSERFISGFLHAPGMDDEKLLMIARVFPSLFPMPLPKIGVIDNNSLASPPLSGSKDVPDTSESIGDTLDKSGPASTASGPVASPGISKPAEEEPCERPSAAPAQASEDPSSGRRQTSYRDSPPGERRQRVYTEPRYYISRDDDDYSRPREYVEYAPSPRIVHSGPAYGEYTGRRTVFREQERIYGPPPEEVVYARPRDGSHGREYSSYSRQARYYDDEDQPAEYRFVREAHSRDGAPARGQSAADRFLDDFVPGQSSGNDAVPPLPAQQQEAQDPVIAPDAPDGVRFASPPPTGANAARELDLAPRALAPPHPRAPSTVSNGSRYEEYHPNARYIPAPDSGGLPRRPGPHRRRDRPHEHRMPSRYYRYMSVARDEPYGRGPSMSRSQSRRYEEQRRRIDQQETPQPNAEFEYEPAYSRDHSVDHAPPEERFYSRPAAREYVSVQDRYPYSPPRGFRYDEQRGPQSVYVDEYGQEVVRVRGEPRHSRGPYMSYPQPARYEPERYEYVPVPYERPPPQRYNSRGEFVYYEERERERDRTLPRRPAPAPEVEPEPYEQPGPDIKVESAPVPMPPDGP
ncbi:hypothetical protein EK21DRAFT_53471 [Setomelanomma holmii]|uniref:DUF7892 domain-containing protein n=1 Tax=Setomelanomma holmii TaxID=210430 RepID=A0A9P4HKK2_9PLEO|nr:hypothetical protein EK21DRAFT_53471 [Setomelanomma holmii]